MAATARVAQKRQSILFAAISNFCGKRSARSDLEPGSEVAVSAQIVGRVARSDVESEFSGTLFVGHETEYQKSTAAKPVEIVATLLKCLPLNKRAGLLRELSISYSVTGELPYDKCHLDEATIWLNSLKQMGTQTRAGAVTLQVD